MLAPAQPWPPDYVGVLIERQRRIRTLRARPDLRLGLAERYRADPVAWINHWAVTYDPRVAGTETPTTMPFVLFRRQEEMAEFLLACIMEQQNGLAEKCRDMGATWLCCAFSVWLWLYWPGAAVGWGSRKEQLVDKIGDPDSIFEKMRIIIRNLPAFMRPVGFDIVAHMPFMKIVNPENGATITGEAGDNIGRGGRKLIYFKDESAHYERPEKIEAALADNTNCQIDISSVNGLGNVFHRRREAGKEWVSGDPLVTDRVNVFIMDWRDHPAKTQEWYDSRKAKATADGLTHIFAQEVDRNYAAAVDGIIIPAEWVKSAIDAHERLGFDDDGGHVGGLDVADEGGDTNALAIRKGVILKDLDEWGDRDTGQTTNKAIEGCEPYAPIDLMYDSVGVGAGVKAEANRLKREKEMPKGINLVPWSAGAGVVDPDKPVEPTDRKSPLNKDMFQNLKAQAWWDLRRRFEKTHRAVTEGIFYDPDELISLPSTLPRLRQLEKELSQPTISKSTGRLRLVVNKTPEGTKSPNLADAVVMAYFPLGKGYTLANL